VLDTIHRRYKVRWILGLIVFSLCAIGLHSFDFIPALPGITITDFFLRWMQDVDLTMAPDEGFYGLFAIGVAGLVYRALRPPDSRSDPQKEQVE